MAILKNSTFTGTFQLPAGTSAQRPAVPVQGMMRYNTSIPCNEMYNGTIWWDMDNNVPSDLGLSAATPATSGRQLLQCRPTYGTGNYWIRPPGQPGYQVYVDMTNQNGGWVLVGRGREGSSTGTAWWNDAGAGLFSSSLVQSALNIFDVAYMPRDWIRALMGGSNWNNFNGMICNRTQLGDSFYFHPYTTTTYQFSWSLFGAATDVQPGLSTFLSYGRYTGQWLTGGNTYNFSNQYWSDTLSSGAPVANDASRLFTWNWSGHSSGGVQYSGWSAGASVNTPGFQAGSEGHAIQQVNVFVK